MSSNFMKASDLVAAGFSTALLALACAAVLLLVGTGWVRRGWKLPVLLAAIAALAGALSTQEARNAWIATAATPLDYFYACWFVSMPLQIAALYFAVRQAGALSVALFWRMIGITALMVLVRYLGDAGYMNATLSFLIGIILWLYVLGELFFGRMDEVVAKSRMPVLRRGYFWLRLIVAIGWAIYPLVQFLLSSGNVVSSGAVSLTYSLFEFPNRIAFGLALLAIALIESPEDKP
ncbi:bacteriorhodopsin [Aestuariivirga sp.]|uniref:bacteriorhodopsin n=1 Tax=Aestuariivirga sp. TaxID=2650926 RepID=UPI0039E31BE7